MTETVGKIYAAIHKVLGSLQVEKSGTLPGNMGNSRYAPASAVSNEVKRLFYENNVILESNETLNQHENISVGDRTRISVSVTGSYRAIHVEDGSSISFSGTGDGLATGTAVSSNIASTNALKNALLRTFLISEDSVEDAGMAEQATPKQNPAQQVAKAASQPKTSTAPGGDAGQQIKAGIEAGTWDRNEVNKLLDKVVKETGKTKKDAQPELLKRLQAGEVA